jgi:hypothetical protein
MRAVARGELHARHSLSPVFTLIGGMFETSLVVERFERKVERAVANAKARRNADRANPPRADPTALREQAPAPSKPAPDPAGSDGHPPLHVDEDTFTVTFQRRVYTFRPRIKLLFALLARISRRPGHRVYYDTLRDAGDVWNGHRVAESSIRSAVRRLRNVLREAKMDGLAAQISTGTYQCREYVVLNGASSG